MDPGSVDSAQICLNGHVVNWSASSRPEFNEKFCDKCGEPTITNCPACNAQIQGTRYTMGYTGPMGIAPMSIPSFCPNCGEPYPWIQAKIQAARHLAMELEGISQEDREVLANSINDIVKETPSTELAATRWKRILSKVGGPALNTAKEILVTVASETVRRKILGG